VALIRKLGIETIDALKEENPNKLHGQLCGLRKKLKLDMKNPSPEDVKNWLS